MLLDRIASYWVEESDRETARRLFEEAHTTVAALPDDGDQSSGLQAVALMQSSAGYFGLAQATAKGLERVDDRNAVLQSIADMQTLQRNFVGAI